MESKLSFCLILVGVVEQNYFAFCKSPLGGALPSIFPTCSAPFEILQVECQGFVWFLNFKSKRRKVSNSYLLNQEIG